MNKNSLILSTADLRVYQESSVVKNDVAEVRLGPVNMAVLVTLVERSGKVVSRADLFDAVWKNQLVSDDVLTRCISDLRAQLGQLSSSIQLIETLPKRGYRWLPEVFTGDPEKLEIAVFENSKENQIVVTVEDKIELEIEAKSDFKKSPIYKSRLNVYFSWFLAISLGLLIISTSTLWIIEKLLQTDLVRVALIPVLVAEEEHQSIASELEDILRGKLLETKGLRFLSRSAVASRPQNPFPYFAHEFGTRWIIEGEVRVIQDKYRLSMSLVDARSATVYYSLTEDISNNPASLNNYADLFVNQITLQLGLNQD